MSSIDVERLLAPISDDSPSGEDLEYDPSFMEMEQAAEGKPEQQYGDTIIPAEEPDWKEVRRLAVDLLSRTKDLRVVATLSRAMLATEGLGGFADCLKLTRGYVEQYWSSVHPKLDPSDDNDPTIRVNTVQSLSDLGSTVRLLKTAPLVESRMAGRFGLTDVQIANGEINPPAGMESPPTKQLIEGAFMDVDLQTLKGTSAAIRDSIGHAQGIEAAFAKEVGAVNGVNLELLVKHLKLTERVVSEALGKRASGSVEELEPSADAGAGTSESPSGQRRDAEQRIEIRAEISSREDVIRTLDKICQYYHRWEPSSPVPLLLHRAKRLATMGFLDILQDLTPSGVEQVKALGGLSDKDVALLQQQVAAELGTAAGSAPSAAKPSGSDWDKF
jgi:type VI secretion system protein ImpA